MSNEGNVPCFLSLCVGDKFKVSYFLDIIGDHGYLISEWGLDNVFVVQ